LISIWRMSCTVAQTTDQGQGPEQPWFHCDSRQGKLGTQDVVDNT
jgi:hypothetical protein